ncbi:DNA-binding transcriptional MerR regulator/methylmalonyl-CoA mutase cobalamin-binding subunit [Bacillus mesophilus]|uniref:MerR family transcriptional regulator n=1 Tax=Bacillus mesophilus TaxID=1808955 RepID=A0A6M0Q9L8_9BACI|nr:MerR family transcriptional regulator [Bacillus mesophilus]MBM7662326.1 DNA-binding transcriptional MerR regulator/methylmalonyl-CoA mutase cobalamin-binding subunit [Bacillus mesophilus]NEY73044.1 MerR family transcriptional regulator [Bacillus mesophilus]
MYNIKKVSEILDIPTVTIRAWETRYQVINPTRTEGGHRLYSEQDIETLKWLKETMQEGNIKIGEAVRLLQKRPIESPSLPETKPGYEGIIEQLYQALIDVNTEQANRLTDLAFTLYDFEEVFQNIFVHVLYKVGDEWENGHITTAQEHFSSQFIIQRCTQFLRILPTDHSLPRALAFCPEGEHHHIGLLLFSLFLRKKGVEVIYLGPNTPLGGLSDLIKMKNISIIAISLTNPEPFESVQSWIKENITKDAHLKFVLGGKAVQQTDLFQSPAVSNLQKVEWNEWFKANVR